MLQVAPDYMKPVRYDARKLQGLLVPQQMTSYDDGIGQTLTWIASGRSDALFATEVKKFGAAQFQRLGVCLNVALTQRGRNARPPALCHPKTTLTRGKPAFPPAANNSRLIFTHHFGHGE